VNARLASVVLVLSYSLVFPPGVSATSSGQGLSKMVCRARHHGQTVEFAAWSNVGYPLSLPSNVFLQKPKLRQVAICCWPC
jgi:hypothetical protein